MSALLPSCTLFKQNQIRRLYDDATETSAERGWFLVIDIIRALIQQPDSQVLRN